LSFVNRTPLLIFDCDGVLVDSEVLATRVLIDGIRAAGGEIDEAQAFRDYIGISAASALALIARDCGVTFNEAQLAAMRTRLAERMRAELRAIPGVAEVLGALPLARCVASSSAPERIRLSLQVTGLLPLFEHIYSASMVERGKPAPDLFLHAAGRLGYQPGDCIVIEDSPAGILAAQAAGMRVLAFTGGEHAAISGLQDRVSKLQPDAVFGEMALLPALLRQYSVV
jgi:HAD superfamily hydrolase (TIGR01509 family)